MSRLRLVGEVVGVQSGEQLVIGAVGVEPIARCAQCSRALRFIEIVGERSRELVRITWSCSGCGGSQRIPAVAS